MKYSLLLLLFPFYLISQSYTEETYQNTLVHLQAMLEEKITFSFKEAVWATENAFYDGQLDTIALNEYIEELATLSQIVAKNQPIDYQETDAAIVSTWASVFSVMTDTIWIKDEESMIPLLPFAYNFEDIFGQKDWSNMFVSTLLSRRKGNCHSMPYLYKIICEELDVPCHIAIAPNHFYIKHRSEKMGWYNTELTSASFPIDAWLMASGYISLQAVQNGIYMEALDAKESIALCVIDLAHGYEHKNLEHDGTFVIQCCELALKYFPNYVNALLLKAETHLLQLQQIQAAHGYAYLKEVTKLPKGQQLWDEMNQTYLGLHQLGYRQMPHQMYLDWMDSLKQEQKRYSNEHIQSLRDR